MKKFLAALLIGLSLVSITLDASAARLGGGASFGRSMSVPKAAPSSPFKAPSAAAIKRPATAAAAGAAAKAPMSMGKRLLTVQLRPWALWPWRICSVSAKDLPRCL